MRRPETVSDPRKVKVKVPFPVRKEGLDVFGQYGRRDETCPVSTGGGEDLFLAARGVGRLEDNVALLLERVVCAVGALVAPALLVRELRHHLAQRDLEKDLRRDAELLGRKHLRACLSVRRKMTGHVSSLLPY
jgi:hypothetical protein